jgi:hypothetical protein
MSNFLSFRITILFIENFHELSSFNKQSEYLRILKTSDSDVKIKLTYSLYCIFKKRRVHRFLLK